MTIAIRPDLTIEACCEFFAYEPKSGLLTWRKAIGKNKRTIGQTVGVIGRAGYRVLNFNGRVYPVHHIVWAVVYGAWPSEVMDHVDGNRLNNRLENLREVTASQNAQNRGASRNNKSGFKGVSWHKASGSWTANIMANRKAEHLGLFATKEQAAEAYDAAAVRLHGKFAVTNAMLSARRHRPVERTVEGATVKMYNPMHGFLSNKGMA